MREKTIEILMRYNQRSEDTTQVHRAQCEEIADEILKVAQQEIKDARNIDDLCARFGFSVCDVV